MPDFDCKTCGKSFEVSQAALDKFPGWTPKQCLRCKPSKAPKTQATPRSGADRAGAPARRVARTPHRASVSREENLTVAEVLALYTDGPQDGVFTDGASHPNPGPGGWGAVYVESGQIVAEVHGHDPDTTNNRMELTALIEGCRLVPEGRPTKIYTDSQLCVDTITRWASDWEKAGWRRKTGPIKNLELVKELYALCQQRPELELTWIKAHSGFRWNEYADALATAYRRGVK